MSAHFNLLRAQEVPGTGEIEGLESCLVRRESAEICDSFTLSYSTRQAALNGDAASYGTRGAPRTRFSHHPHLDRFDHLDRLLAVVLIFGA